MKGAAQFYLDWLIEDADGHLVTAPSTSPEHKFYTESGQLVAVRCHHHGPLPDLAAVTDCLAAQRLLAVDPELHRMLEVAINQLYPRQFND